MKNFVARWIHKGFSWIGPFVCYVFGNLVYYGLRSRRRILLHNLTIAFPDKSEHWRRQLARKNCIRWIETGWLFFCTIFWSRRQIRKHFLLSDNFRRWLDHRDPSQRPVIGLIPHLNLMESLLYLPCWVDIRFPMGVIYRSFRNPWLARWMEKYRKRFGIHLIERNHGTLKAKQILAHNGGVGIFFDQSAGEAGCLTTFFDRLASCTPLPGLLAEAFDADVVVMYVQRTGFLRGLLCIEEILSPKTVAGVTLAANQWLEQKLKADASFYENWLWLHRRWKTQCKPAVRFRIEQKRNLLPDTMRYHQWQQLPQKIAVWIRMPNWLGDCIMVYPLLKALREARPDFSFHVVVQKRFATLLEAYFPVDFIYTLPSTSGLSYFKAFWSIRQRRPEIWMNFTNSIRSDLESFCAGAPQRFGLQKQGARPLLTHTYKTTPQPNEHQTELWYRLLQYFGLQVPLDRTPRFSTKIICPIRRFGCFCGSSNMAAKRWPLSHWQKLIQSLLEHFPQAQCLLMGSAKDGLLCEQIAKNLPADRVENAAGLIDLVRLCNELQTCSFVIGNDSGGMHLSNFCGVPTVGLFGPTKPSWGGPFYDAPTCCIASDNGTMHDLQPESVFHPIIAWLQTLNLH